VRRSPGGPAGVVEIRVEDNGPGIAETANLFVPFFTTKPEGSGIGLVLCQQIAENHGGSLELYNRDDRSGLRRDPAPAPAGADAGCRQGFPILGLRFPATGGKTVLGPLPGETLVIISQYVACNPWQLAQRVQMEGADHGHPRPSQAKAKLRKRI
jgi:signal transduction histidine kinase